MGTLVGEPGVESGLSASLGETECAAVVGEETTTYPEASSDHETPKEPDAPSSCVPDPKGVSVSVLSSLNMEEVTMLEANFFGRSSGCTCSSCWSGSAWGHVLEIILIVKAYNQSGRWGDKL